MSLEAVGIRAVDTAPLFELVEERTYGVIVDLIDATEKLVSELAVRERMPEN